MRRFAAAATSHTPLVLLLHLGGPLWIITVPACPTAHSPPTPHTCTTHANTAIAACAPGGGGDLTLTDLISGLGDSKSKLGAARKALERLEKRATPVSAPLPGPIRQRQERKAG